MSEAEGPPRAAAPLPKLILIADGFTREEVACRAVAAVEAGVPWLHLRDHEAGDEVFSQAVRILVDRLRHASPEVAVSVNSRLEVARTFGLGLHTGVHGASVDEAVRVLGPAAPVGYSAHDPAEAKAALESGAGYVFISPVFATSSKPEQSGIGVAGLQQVTRAVPGTPVFALGGITPDRVGACLRAGAHGVAVLSGILDAEDVASSVHAYLEAVREPGRNED